MDASRGQGRMSQRRVQKPSCQFGYSVSGSGREIGYARWEVASRFWELKPGSLVQVRGRPAEGRTCEEEDFNAEVSHDGARCNRSGSGCNIWRCRGSGCADRQSSRLDRRSLNSSLLRLLLSPPSSSLLVALRPQDLPLVMGPRPGALEHMCSGALSFLRSPLSQLGKFRRLV